MRRTTTLIFLLLVCTSALKSQTPKDSLLLALEWAYFSTPDDSIKTTIAFQKMEIHLMRTPLSNQVLLELKRVDPDYLSQYERENYYWNASLVNYSMNRTYHTLHYVDLYERNIDKTTISFELLKFLTYIDYDTTTAHKLFNDLVRKDSSLQCLSCIEEIRHFELKHKQIRIIASYLFPGIGIAITGKPLKGILSLCLNTLSAAAITYTIQHQLWVNSIGWGSNLIGKFYAGNVRLLLRTIEDKEQAQKKKLAIPCELQLGIILDKYPLNFRFSNQ